MRVLYTIGFALGVAVALSGLSGCRYVNPSAGEQQAAAGRVVEQAGRESNGGLTRDQLALRVRVLADEFAARWSRAGELAGARAPDLESRRRIHELKLEAINAAYLLAAGDQPEGAVLNLLVLTALQRTAMEDLPTDALGGQQPLLLASAIAIENEGWAAAEAVMNEQQIEDLRLIIERWHEANPGVDNYWSIRFAEFEAYSSGTLFQEIRGGVVNMPRNFLDLFVPVASAQQSVSDGARLAERMSWLAPRQMLIAQWRVEATLYETLAEPNVSDSLENLQRFADSAERVSLTVEQAPELIEREREALVAALENSQDGLSSLLDDYESALQASRDAKGDALELVDAVDAALVELRLALEALDRIGEPAEGADEAPSEPGRPFDIREYTAAAEAIGQASIRVREMFVETERLATDSELTRAADARVDHVFKRAVQWLGLAAVVGALWIVLASRLRRRQD